MIKKTFQKIREKYVFCNVTNGVSSPFFTSRIEQEGRGEWLQRVLAEEVDVRPPKSNVNKEEEYLQRCAHVTLFGQVRPAGHCELRRCGGALELCTVIVDSEKRGIGYRKPSFQYFSISLSFNWYIYIF